jgi:hypothetical protein
MFQDNIERYETRVDVHKSLLKISIEMLLRTVKYIQHIVHEMDERHDLDTLLYSVIKNIQIVMLNANKLEYIISDLSINSEQILWIKNI